MDDTTASESRIVVGVDGSEASRDTLRWAAHQASLTGAALELVMAWHVPIATYGATAGATYGATLPVSACADLGPASRDVVDAIVSDVLKDTPSVKFSIVVVEDHPAHALLRAAEGADLLVVGRRGHGTVAGMVLGSVSRHCSTHATCPVVLVHHRANR